MLSTVANHATESLVWPVSVFNKVVAGIGDDWSYPFKLIWEPIKEHDGNQFELAHHYPSIMIVIMVGSLVGGIFRMLGTQAQPE